jgi:cytosine/adenosine deaminase-related metal-dependent hydrolase
MVTIEGDKIVAVEPAGTRATDEDLGNAAILPGFVNAHTHLDLSDARGKIPPTPDFTAWLRGVIEHRREQTAIQVGDAVAQGIAEAQTHGTTVLGDIAAKEVSWLMLVSAQVRSVVFQELIGLTAQGAREALAVMHILTRTAKVPQYLQNVKIPGLSAMLTKCRPGLSPHAPYSFRADAIPDVAHGATIAIHLAESMAEVELLERHSGPFVPFLAELGVWDPSGLARDLRHVVELTSNAERVLLVHCNYLPADTPIPSHATVVYCPRTHAAFGHPPHPFREFIKRGVRVVLGTDSLASNPDLDILAEARFVHARHPDLSGETLLRMITLDGAIALGWGDMTGSLTPGKSADMVVLAMPDREAQDPYRLIFESTLGVQRVLFRGE